MSDFRVRHKTSVRQAEVTELGAKHLSEKHWEEELAAAMRGDVRLNISLIH